jgi:hypothetical protein
MNYYPKDFTWDRFWLSYTMAIPQIERELDEAKSLGVNTVRLFTPYHLFSGTVPSAYPGYLADFVDRLESRQMVVIVTLFDFYPNASTAPYMPADYLASKQHLNTIINTLGPTNPTILAWDIKNELDRDYTVFGQVQVKAWANEMISYTRQLDPNHLVTIGFYGTAPGPLCHDPALNTLVYSPTIAAEFAPAVDVVSLHYFLSERCFEADVQGLRAFIGDKPLLLEEFGLHTLASPVLPCSSNPGNPLCDDPHTEIEQAAYYNTLLSISEAYGLAGYLFWTLNDFSHILPNTQQSHHCQGIRRNSLVMVCEATSPANYSPKPAAQTSGRHYEDSVAYLDLFDGWVDSDVDAPPAGWSDNWEQGGALLRSYNATQPLWSHHQGKVAVAKFVTGSVSITGLAVSPIVTEANIEQFPFLTGRVFDYSVRDAVNGSNSVLYIGVKEGAQLTRLLTVTAESPLPHCFSLDLRQRPLNWSGIHNFQISIELVPEAGTNGYSAVYELDWLALTASGVGSCVYLPLIVKSAL